MVTVVSRADSRYMQEIVELRAHIARSLQGCADAIGKDALAVYAFAGMEDLSAEDRDRFADLAVQLLIAAIRDGSIESRHALIGDLWQRAAERQLGIRLLFTVVYLVERSALDELALDESFGIDSQPWAGLIQIVRRASLDVHSALAEQISAGPVQTGITDALTTLHSRVVFLAALEKEIQRAERFGHPFALIVIDVDHLQQINVRHGYGAGDRVLERVGIVVRGYFRETDWVARVAGDTFAVLLPETQGSNAERLAERMRITVQERLQLHDHRSDQHFPVTISVGVLIAESVDQHIKAERLLADAEAAVGRAIVAGGNRVERAEAVVGGASAPTRDGPAID